MMIIACRQFMRKYWEIVEYMQMLNSIYIFMFNELMTRRRQLFSSKLDLQAPIQVIDLCRTKCQGQGKPARRSLQGDCPG